MLEAEEEEHVSLDSVDTAELPALNYEQRHEREETATATDPEPQAEAIDSPEDNEWSETQLTGPSETPWSGDGDRSDEFADAGGETLQDHLMWQLQMSRLTELDKKIGTAIIDAINDDGYLSEPLEEIAQNLKPETVVTVDDIARVLPHVQAMDPAGVGARSVAECIELQLQQLDIATPGRETAITIARNYLDQVADQQWGILRRQLRATEEETDCALALVRACQPRPGAAIHSSSPMYSYVAPTTVGR
jgi:RNA polymerase sigma-54 factor